MFVDPCCTGIRHNQLVLFSAAACLECDIGLAGHSRVGVQRDVLQGAQQAAHFLNCVNPLLRLCGMGRLPMRAGAD